MGRTVDERRLRLDDLLAEYEGRAGLNAFKEDFHDEKIQRYFTMDAHELNKLEPEDCAIAGVELAQLAFHIQRSYNVELARLNWAESTIQQEICDQLNGYSGSFTQKEQQAIKENSFAKELNKVKTYCKQRMDRLTFVATSIKNLADKIERLQAAKQYRRDV